MMRRVWLSLLVLLGAGLLASGWYAYDRGFTRKWRGYVAGEFRKRGVELWVSKLTFHPFRGIIAKNVKIFDARDRRRVLAGIDEMRLVINWANLVQGTTFLDALELTEATLSLPLDPKQPTGQKLEISGLSGRLFLPPQQAYLSRLEADLYGVHVTATGRLINPQKLQRALTTDAPWSDTLAGAAAVIFEKWRELEFSGPRPELHLSFSGDLAQPERLVAEMTLWAERVTWRKVPLEKLYLTAGYREGRIEVKQLTASDDKGALQLSGQYEVALQRAAVSLNSTLDAGPWLRALGQSREFAQLALPEPPTIELTCRLNFDPALRLHLLGHLDAVRFTYAGTDFQQGVADFSWDGERWSARDIRIVHRTGELTADILHAPEGVRTKVKSTIAPGVLRPLLTGAAAEWLEGS